MTQFIGQKNLLETLNKYTLSTLPKTLLLIGPAGCGKKTITDYICEKFNFDLVVIDENITQDQLIDFSQKTVPTVYRVDLANFSEKLQNQFLKFIEEPSDSVYVVLTADSEIGILSTILNRCVKLTFEPYSIADLQQFYTSADPTIFEICKTPGSLKNISQKQFDALLNTCSNLCEYAPTIAFPKVLAISAQVNCKEDYDKFDFNTFFDTMSYVSYKRFKDLNDEISFKIYLLTNKFKQSRINKAIAKENFLLNYLSQVYEAVH